MARPCVPEGDRALLGLGWGKKYVGMTCSRSQRKYRDFSLFSTSKDPDIIKLTSGTGSRFANHRKSVLGFAETYKN
jgi:hypothetical protein